MIRFIDCHKELRTEGLRWGVEPMCAVLPIAPQTYYAARKREPSTRSLRDEDLKAEILRVFEENYSVYGAKKLWRQLNREGFAVARCTIERLMRELGIRGATQGRRGPTTTRPSPAAAELPDLVERVFAVAAPNRLWVADLTYVWAWSGFVYVALVIDAFADRIVGWRASRSLRTVLALDALEQAIWGPYP